MAPGMATRSDRPPCRLSGMNEMRGVTPAGTPALPMDGATYMVGPASVPVVGYERGARSYAGRDAGATDGWGNVHGRTGLRAGCRV